jgi:hypothetical protein
LWGSPVGVRDPLASQGRERGRRAGWPFGPKEGSEACCARWAEGKQKGEVFFCLFSFLFLFISKPFETHLKILLNPFEF